MELSWSGVEVTVFLPRDHTRPASDMARKQHCHRLQESPPLVSDLNERGRSPTQFRTREIDQSSIFHLPLHGHLFGNRGRGACIRIEALEEWYLDRVATMLHLQHGGSLVHSENSRATMMLQDEFITVTAHRYDLDAFS